jgi:hypothetical protein
MCAVMPRLPSGLRQRFLPADLSPAAYFATELGIVGALALGLVLATVPPRSPQGDPPQRLLRCLALQ